MEDNCIVERSFCDIQNGDNIYFVDGIRIYPAEITDILQTNDGSVLKLTPDSGIIPLKIPKEAMSDDTVITERFDACYSDVHHAVDVVRDRINKEIDRWTETINFLKKQLEEAERLIGDED